MIDHSGCDHPATSGARAKCRRARGGGATPKESTGKRATPKTWGGKAHHDPDRPRNTGTTPRDRDKQCMVCTVERICCKGTDPLTGQLLYLGERCMYRIERSEDFVEVE
jgi:hypothetical protein